MKYYEAFDRLGAKTNECVLFCNDGVHIIKLADYDSFNENKQVEYGEQGRTHYIYMCITEYNMIHGEKEIYNYLTQTGEY